MNPAEKCQNLHSMGWQAEFLLFVCLLICVHIGSRVELNIDWNAMAILTGI